MKKYFKKNGAITLIALVITIIILIILAGVTIVSLTGDNGLLNRAVGAKTLTEEAKEKEKIQIEVFGSYDDSGKLDIETLKTNLTNHLYLQATHDNSTKFPLTVTYIATKNCYEIDRDGNVGYIQITDRTGIAVGDYIDYTPDVASTTVYPHTTLDTYSGSTSNTADIIQDTLDWQVLRIYRDGSMDLIGSNTSQSIYFLGVLGYTNGVYLMDDICKTLYSRNANNIIARSVDLDDFDYWLEQSTGGVAARNEYINVDGYTYGESVIYTSTSRNKYPPFYKTKTSESDPGTLTTNSSYAIDGELTVEQTDYQIYINNTNFSDGYKAFTSYNGYWLASRCIQCRTSEAYFGLYKTRNNYCDGMGIFVSNGFTANEFNSYLLRPVVHLKSSAQITAKTGTTGDKHQITSY